MLKFQAGTRVIRVDTQKKGVISNRYLSHSSRQPKYLSLRLSVSTTNLYKAMETLRKERVVDNDNYESHSLLVIAGEMTDLLRQVANDLGVKYIENFN